MKTLADKTKEILQSDILTKKNLSDSKKWFKENMNSLLYSSYRITGITQSPQRLYSEKRENVITRASQIEPGSLYFWFYDPKYKRTLPYYDTFPVAFIIDMYNNGFLGINLHYLPVRSRAILMTRLIENMLRKTTQRTYLDLQYQTLNSASRYREFKPCLKRYLISHIKGKMVAVPQEEWIKTIFLPLERFEKKGKSFVWSESKKIISGR